MTYNDLNIHPRDTHLSFDPDTHSYHFDGREMTSVTTLVEDCFPKFDKNYWAARKALQEGVDPDMILDRWDREAQHARDLGTMMHDKIEHYYLGEDQGDDTDAYRLFRLFAANNRLHPYRTEWRIYHEDFDLAGTLDFIECTPQGKFNIYDWKRSKKLIDPTGRILTESRYRATGLHPVNHLPDTSYWHYALQVSIYRFILEEKYGISVSKMRLGVFHPSYHTPWIVELPYLHNEVRSILSHKLSHSAIAF
ncbi:hypothetical protein [Duncaniella freteri]|uniref:hypothetical protein n=1 Tax=Duncaniella freteri TaxID=2530391 RepID=UPI002557D60A|nr:hypothetical protein [Duncaniella freteri]